jgi:hypothetical protein
LAVYQNCKSELKNTTCAFGNVRDGWISNLLVAQEAYANIGGFIHEILIGKEFSMQLHTKEQLKVLSPI